MLAKVRGACPASRRAPCPAGTLQPSRVRTEHAWATHPRVAGNRPAFPEEAGPVGRQRGGHNAARRTGTGSNMLARCMRQELAAEASFGGAEWERPCGEVGRSEIRLPNCPKWPSAILSLEE